MSKELITRIISSLIMVPLSFYFIIKGNVLFTLFTLIILLISLYEWHLLSFKKKYYLPGIIFIFFSIYTFYYFRNEGEYNIFFLIIIVCIGTDIGGYAFGKLLKGPKLTKISPNKTYSGMFGSFILSIVFAYIYFKNLSFFSF
ncbi:phosphatidate cytidylyltransferase [Candidatus Pelagibacter sp.]|nr:phosphatidate cytidylyltransferase [Candidatus Pelagibacter sp.]